MGTFFEKFTGSSQKPAEPEPIGATSPREEIKRPVKKSVQKPKEPPHHLNVETDDAGEEQLETTHEEEGELTVDIYDKGDEIVIQSTVAGVKPEDLDVSITNDTVTIRGRRAQQEEIAEENYYYKELFWGAFSRSVILPEEIDEDSADASLKHGLLVIKLPKKKKGVVQKLKVKVT